MAADPEKGQGDPVDLDAELRQFYGEVKITDRDNEVFMRASCEFC